MVFVRLNALFLSRFDVFIQNRLKLVRPFFTDLVEVTIELELVKQR